MWCMSGLIRLESGTGYYSKTTARETSLEAVTKSKLVIEKMLKKRQN